MRIKNVCILGGTGFVGRHIASRLGDRNDINIRVPTRNRERQRDLLVLPNLRLTEIDVYDAQDLQAQFADVDCVINLIGILNDSSSDKHGFQQTHVELPRKIIEACQATGVRRLLHMSALGAADDAPSHYLRSKAEAESLVLQANTDDFSTTCFRPSVIFGSGDSFFCRFADLLKRAPGFFPLPTPNTRYSPVFVGDVADAFVNSLTDDSTFGQAVELCGPQSYTLRELVEYTAQLSGSKSRIIGLGDRLSRLQARILGRMPGQPYSYDNYLSATLDNTCSGEGLQKLGVQPTAIEAVVPRYLAGIGARRRYDSYRKDARRA